MFVYVVCVTHPELLLLAPDLGLTQLSCLRSLTQNINQSCLGLFFFLLSFSCEPFLTICYLDILLNCSLIQLLRVTSGIVV